MVSSVIRRLNDRRDAAADLGEDAGFTLIELMVVLLILAILLAIAIPTFLGVTGGANDRAAQSNLNTALTTAKAAETQNNQSYTGISATTLGANEPSIKFLAGATTGQGDVSVYVDAVAGEGNGIVMASYSKAGFCWYVSDNVATVTDTAGPYTPTTPAGGSAPLTAGTSYGKAAVANAAACDATKALPATTTWQTGKFPA
jgi:type IV pilus assembly protein PilA